LRNLFQQVFRKSSAALLMVALASIMAVGCGDSENFVFTNPAPVANTGNLTFNFIQAQGVIAVPIGTTTLEFTFFDGLNQTGNVTLTDTQPYAAQVTVVGVPVVTQSYRIVARNANGAALASASGNVTVVPGQTITVDVTNVVPILTPPTAAQLDVFVSNAGNGANLGDIDLFDSLFNLVRTFTGNNDEGISVDGLCTGFHNDDATVDIIATLGDRTGAFDSDLDRTVAISGATGIKGGVVIQDEGLLVLADSSDGEIHIFGTAALSGSVIANLAAPANPWDMTYDNAGDRLYVAFTDGTVGVYDTFAADVVAGNASGTPDRTITTNGLDNAHGIAYDSATNLLIVSDVGAATTSDQANFNTDGEIFVIANGSTASGTIDAQAVISGSNTQLGNPVDIDLQGADLRVAEKANNVLLVFTNILATTGGNLAPSVSVAESAPESLTSKVIAAFAPDNSDIDGGVTVQNILVSTNTSDLTGVAGSGENMLLRINTGLTSIADAFDSDWGGDGESVAVDGQGDAYFTATDGGPWLTQYGRVANGTRDTNNTDFDPAWDRDLELSGITAAGELKGLDIVDSRGVVILADFAGAGTAGAIHVVGKYGDSGDAIFSVATADSSPWDVDYDPAADRLFVAMTNGTVRVYDNFLDDANPGSQLPDRTISLGASNLHGIVYDAVNDILIVSDVGAATTAMQAGFNTDGAIFVIANASTASGTVTPAASNSGNDTNLGNPVDIAYDGTNLYVAEKANNEIQRYDNIRSLTGMNNVAPSAQITVQAPESVSLITGL